MNSASTSTENLTTPTGSNSRLYRIPSLPRNRNKSGIPVSAIHRDLSQPPVLRGQFSEPKKKEYKKYIFLVQINLFKFPTLLFCCSHTFHISFPIFVSVSIYLYYRYFNYNKNLYFVIGNLRSISALDSAAVQRARARQQYSSAARMKVTAGPASLRKLPLYFR